MREERLTHLVLKLDEIQKYLNPREQGDLGVILEKIRAGRAEEGKHPYNYLVVNEDEPYFEEIYQIVLKREEEKR